MREYPDGSAFCPHCGYDVTAKVDSLYGLKCGTMLASGRYVLGLIVSTGGFGIVYKAWDVTFDKLVAIKEYYPSGIAARMPESNNVIVYSNESSRENFAQGKERFLTEAKKMAQFVDVPSIVDVYDCFEENDTAYMVMEYMDGMTFGQYLERAGGKTACDQAVNVCIYILDALNCVHKANIIHRDINPNNIFICNDGRVKLFDFGAARIDGGEMIPIVTPGYAPPEQYSTEYPQGIYTDIYAVGATLYRAVTGIKPEESSDRLSHDTVKEPHKIDSSIPRSLSNAIMRAMALKKELRFRNVEEFREVLLEKKKVLGVEGEITRRRRRRMLQAAAIFVILGAVGTTCWLKRDKGLEAASLSVWVAADKNSSVEETQQKFQSIQSQIDDIAVPIDLDLTIWSSDEYEERLNQAAREGSLPDVFDSTCLSSEFLDLLEPLDMTKKLIDESSEEYYYLDQYEKYFPEQLQMPLRVQYPLEFVRTGNNVQNTGKYAVNPDMSEVYADAMGESFLNAAYTTPDAIQAFEKGTVDQYFSDTSDYTEINQTLQAQYSLEIPDMEEPERFDHLWSVNKSMQGSKKDIQNRKRAGEWLIYYLLSEQGQETLGYASGVPLNKNACDNYFNVYQGELHDMQKYLP
jgi:serine/threonine protein kinase